MDSLLFKQSFPQGVVGMILAERVFSKSDHTQQSKGENKPQSVAETHTMMIHIRNMFQHLQINLL